MDIIMEPTDMLTLDIIKRPPSPPPPHTHTPSYVAHLRMAALACCDPFSGSASSSRYLQASGQEVHHGWLHCCESSQ
jgi:hypothetical protein